MIIYCLKCKQKTETIDQMEVQSKNGREMIREIVQSVVLKSLFSYRRQMPSKNLKRPSKGKASV